MTSSVSTSVTIQTAAHSVPTPPSWFGEVTLMAHHLSRQGVLDRISEQVRFARRRFGRYEVIDFLAVLFGYAISAERTLEAFYKRLQPWASAFMALFGRERLPARSTLSRFLAALTSEPIEALRTLFLHDLLARPLGKAQQLGGLWDRAGKPRVVFDIDGTREAARQQALPQTARRNAGSVTCVPRLHGTQTRGSSPHPHDRLAGAHASVARHLRRFRQRPIPGRTASGSGSY